MKITYTRVGDYEIPNLKVEDDSNYASLGKYGRMRLLYLKENYKGYYLSLKIKNELYKHAKEIEIEAIELYNLLIKKYIIQNEVSEQLKETDNLEWMKKMNILNKYVEEKISSFLYNI